MNYAENISDIPNVFKATPLNEDELDEFYCDNTMEFRTGDKYISHILDIYEACQIPSDRNAFLLLGHRGCGKSTELNSMAARLGAEGYQVSNIKCGQDLDLNNPLYADLLILMGEALLQIAAKTNCKLSDKIIDQIKSFWNTEITDNYSAVESDELSMETGAQAETPRFLASILQLFIKVKADLKYSEEKRKEYRKKISHRSSEWLSMLRQVSDEITQKLKGKQPILIFEDLDKLDPQNAWEVFSNNAATLTGVSFPVIYTFPIALAYDPRFAALEGYFTIKTLPMIKLETMDGKTYQQGIAVIREIAEKRSDLGLFEENVLETLIKKTGGSLRDLFYTINASAHRALRRKANVISDEDIQNALEELKTSLTRRIERKHYEFLADICNGNRQTIENKEMLLSMLQANAVLEYNGKRWHNVHPLVRDFLIEQGVVKQGVIEP